MLRKLGHSTTATSLLLIGSTLAALLVANSSLSEIYAATLQFHILGLSLLDWINDGLMAIFFYVIGLEIKREVLVGALSSVRKASLPVCAAIGGMIVPALIFCVVRAPNYDGWAVPMATDIAFALGVLALLGKRVPPALRVLLVTLATADDLGAILVIATVFSSGLNYYGLLLALGGLAGVMLLKRFKVSGAAWYLGLAAVVWFGFLRSGIHATIAGVALAMLTPSAEQAPRRARKDVLGHLIEVLHPWVNVVIMPVFAFANAGVRMTSGSISLSHPLSLGIIAALVIGKPLGILVSSRLAVALNFGSLPSGISWRDVFGIASLAGIGFTMAIFIVTLGLPTAEWSEAKVAVLVASFISAIFGYTILRVTSRMRRQR